jgi:hypothetical protein
MARYTFTCENFDYSNPFDTKERLASTLTQEFRADELTTVIENFEMFLRGAGFHFNGQLDIVNVDEWNEDSDGIEEFETPQFDEEEIKKRWDATIQSMMNPPKFRASEEKCSVCNIAKSQMKGHRCWDTKCPILESATDAN